MLFVGRRFSALALAFAFVTCQVFGIAPHGPPPASAAALGNWSGVANARDANPARRPMAVPPRLLVHHPSVAAPSVMRLARPMRISPRGVLVQPLASMLHPDFRAHKDPLAMRRAISSVQAAAAAHGARRPQALGSRPVAAIVVPICTPDAGNCDLPGPTPHPIISPTPVPAPTPAPTATPVPPAQTPTPLPVPTWAPTATAFIPTVSGSSGSGTGMKRWWAYDSAPVYGIGSSGVNVVTGNMLVTAKDDLSYPNVDVPLEFQRVYNSQSNHDAAGHDGGFPSLYGNGWTNGFDARLMVGPNGGLTVFDQTGTRYDYTPDGSGGWQPPAGLHATLAFDGGAGYQWTDKNGRVLYFYSPTAAQYGAQYATVAGRLYMILGRDRNVFLRFNYYYVGSGTGASGSVIDHIVVQTQSNVSATLQFGNANGHQELNTLAWPDGSVVTYSYDGTGNLTAVWRPGNGSGTPGNLLQEQYGYTGTSYLAYVFSPRWVNSGGSYGGYRVWANYDGLGRPASTTAYGVENFMPADGTNTVLQPSLTVGDSALNTTAYAYAAGWTQLTDFFGHNRLFVYDSSGRIAQRSDSVTPATYLTTMLTWDALNNLGAVTDARGNITSFQYDGNGNVSAIGGPLTTTSQGTFRPTQLIDHDAFNNVTAYCDAYQANATGGGDWPVGYTGYENPGDPAPCARTTAGWVPHTSATYTYPAGEPYGRLATVVNALGYTQTFTYDPGHQSGQDYGLPTQVIGQVGGAWLTQPDGTIRDPGIGAWYDTNGNLLCYATGNGRVVYTYDAMGRNTSEADADDTSSAAGCPKPNGQPGWNTVVATVHLPNGQVASTQTPSQRNAGVSTALAYDEDGNAASVTEHHAGILGTTKYFYDGADRLVEVQLPTATGEPTWATRYLYDLTGQPTAYGGVTVSGHGNLVDVRRRVTHSWLDMAMQSSDVLDRVVTQYAFAPCPNTGATGAIACSAPPGATNFAYDAGNAQGLLTSVTDPLGEMRMYAYDAQGKVVAVQYAGDSGLTPAMSYTYDASGRLSTANAANLGTAQYTYDANGVLATRQEPAALGNALTTFTNYPDGMLAGVSFAGASLNQPNLFQYAYRRDGMLQTQIVNYRGQSSIAYTYTPAGRLLQVSDVGAVPSQTRQYDTSGRLSSYAIPAGTYGAFGYDPEGEVVAYQGYQGESVNLSRNVRGELTGEGFSPNPLGGSGETWPAFGVISSLGTLVQDSSQTWDSRTGAVLGFGGSTYAYDAAGRLTSGPQGQTYAYDAENRLVSGSNDQSYVPQNCGGYWTPQSAGRSTGTWLSRYVYGPEGSVAQTVETVITGGLATATRHWIGGVPFVVDDAGGVEDVHASTDASMSGAASDATGLNVVDRDPFGDVTSHHNGTGYAGWNAPNPYHQVCVAGGSIAASAGYHLPYTSDSIQFTSIGTLDDGFNMMEGNNVVSPSTVTWTTPQSDTTPYVYGGNDPGSRHTLDESTTPDCATADEPTADGKSCPEPVIPDPQDPALQQCPSGRWAVSCAKTSQYDPCALGCFAPNNGTSTPYRRPIPVPNIPPFANPHLFDRPSPQCIPYEWSLTGSHDPTDTTAAHLIGEAMVGTVGAIAGAGVGGKVAGTAGAAVGGAFGGPGIVRVSPGIGATVGGALGDMAYKWEYSDTKPQSLFGMSVCPAGAK